MNEEMKSANSQSSLAGVVITEEEKLWQAKKAEMKKKYRLMSIALIAVIIVAGVFLAKSIWTGWISSSGNRYYYIKGEKVIGLATIENKQYFFDDSGAMQTGWQNADGNTYYFSSDGVMQTGWVELSEKKYYLATSGVLQTGWKKIDGNNYLFDRNGVMQTGWQTIDGSTYYFSSDGVMQTGWIKLSQKKYYLATNGALQTGWKKIDGSNYLFDRNGVMQTGWQTVDGGTYYFNNDGIMQTGFQTINGNKYYLGDSGVLHTGWLSHKNQTYYCSSSNGGKLATGKWTIDGENYYFNNDGIMATGAVEISTNNVYYFDDNGHFQYYEITQNNIGSSRVDERVTFTSRSGGQTWSDYIKLDTPLEGVLSLSGDFSITEMKHGNCDGQWQLHVRTSNGEWKRIGFFEVKDGKGQFEFVLDDPVSFDAYVCTCYESKNWSGSFRQDLNTVTYRTYDYGSNIKSE